MKHLSFFLVISFMFLTLFNDLQAQNIGINTPSPAFPLDVNGRIRLRYNGVTSGLWLNKADNTTASFLGQVNDSVLGIFNSSDNWKFYFDHKNGYLGIGLGNPKIPLSFPSLTGKKISLYPGTNGDAGLGIFGNEFRINSDYSGADITFGYDTYNAPFTERMRIKGTGNVGIATNNPSQLFTVKSNGIGVTQESPDGLIQMGFYTNNTAAFLQTHTNHPLNFSTNNASSQMTLLVNGNFGIGTAVPSQKLEVNGRMLLRYNGATAGIWLNKQDNSATSNFIGNYNDTVSGIYNSTSGWNILFDHKNGRLGIDIANPKVPLSFPAIVGKKISLYPGSNGDAGLGIFGNELRINSDHVGADITFGYDTYNSAFTEKMRIKGNGEVLIGTTTPALGYLLSVNGKAIAEEVRVQLKASWPDYVFKKDYKLFSLIELEKFVKENNHLPGFQKAEVIEKEGSDLGETQRKLLEKVEELTLYIIDLNKRMGKLEEENAALKTNHKLN